MIFTNGNKQCKPKILFSVSHTISRFNIILRSKINVLWLVKKIHIKLHLPPIIFLHGALLFPPIQYSFKKLILLESCYRSHEPRRHLPRSIKLVNTCLKGTTEQLLAQLTQRVYRELGKLELVRSIWGRRIGEKETFLTWISIPSTQTLLCIPSLAISIIFTAIS
jgi:hypothetical protein